MKSRVNVSTPMLAFVAMLLVVVGFIAGSRIDQMPGGVGAFLGFKTVGSSLDLSSVEQTYRMLQIKYDGRLDSNALIDGANRGLVSAAGDTYTSYFNAEEAEEFNDQLSGDVGAGIGAEIAVRSGEPTIIRLLDDNPAAESGLRRGDQIASVNDESTKGWTSDKTATAIRGESGTTVKVGVIRAGKSYTYTITRQTINNPSVYGRVDGTIGIMTISRFDEQTGGLARKVAENFRERNVTGVIVDIRSDGGGYVNAATSVAGLWLKDTVVMTQRKGDIVQDRQKTGSDTVLEGLKTIVLVNEGSASASEILAAALRENAGARLVGTKTFGKGSVQEIVSLQRDALLKVTVAKWYTNKGVNVDDNGLVPDHTVELTQKDFDNDKDPQLEKALELLR